MAIDRGNNFNYIFMKKMTLDQMEMVEGGTGQWMPCGQAIVIGGMFFGWLGMALVALGPNCLDLAHQR
jgi:hypothetical protein